MAPARRRPPTSRAVERPQVVERARRRPTRSRRCSVAPSTAARPSRSGPSRVPSRPISVTTSAATPASANSAATSSRSRPEPCSQPRTATSRPRASSPTATGNARRQATHQVGLLERRGAEHDPGHAGVDAAPRPRPRRAPLPRSAPAPTRRPRWPRTTGRFDRLAGAGRVEVDDVDPGRALGLEGQGLGHRVVAVDGLAAVVALVEAHAPAVAQVDGRIELDQRAAAVRGSGGDGGAIAPRRRSSSAPAGRWPPTSRGGTGWPTALPRSTAAMTGPP